MRAPFLMLPLALALAAPAAAVADQAPRVLFCSGDCFAVDAQGTRTPAPKGTQLQRGQRLETGPGSYAQVKLGPDGAFGIGENARVRLDSKGIVLDQGRIRVIGAQAVELRTADSTFQLRGADVEMKRSGPAGPASPTLVKVNAGDARVGNLALPLEGVQAVTGGQILPGAPIPVSEIAMRTPVRPVPVAQAGAVISLPLLPVNLAPIALPPSLPPAPPPVARVPEVLPPVLTRVTLPPPPIKPVLAGGKGERDLYRPVLNTRTGEIMTLNSAIKLTVDPTLTVKTISPTLISPTILKEPVTTQTTVFTTTRLTTTTTTTPIKTDFKLLSPTTTLIRR